MIEVKNVVKGFGEQIVLSEVNAVFQTGKVNFIIGRSGSGKSVLTKCIVGAHSEEISTKAISM
tara:strand:+ start:545 stop:733 length:189 start_codon:yes stop_codon:yes gene_type:complete